MAITRECFYRWLVTLTSACNSPWSLQSCMYWLPRSLITFSKSLRSRSIANSFNLSFAMFSWNPFCQVFSSSSVSVFYTRQTGRQASRQASCHPIRTHRKEFHNKISSSTHPQQFHNRTSSKDPPTRVTKKLNL
jgi:hypothetical protein